jgi:hypothetical protein
MAETWKKCTACKNDIRYGANHWVCSVSTCNRSNTGYVFCTVSCWDSHVAQLRHRDAWAVDARAPTKDAWEKELAASPPPPPAPAPAQPAAPVVRRVVGEPPTANPPAPGAAAGAALQLSDAVDKDVLIVVSKMKKYIKDRAGMNCGDAVVDLLSEHVRAICDEAIRAAARDDRKTVLERDVPRPRR